MKDIMIRPASVSDIPAVYDFVSGLSGSRPDLAKFSVCFTQCIAAPHNHYLLAVHEGKAIGYISCHGQMILHHCGMVYEIQEMYVDEACRSMGIGRRLLNALDERLAGGSYELLKVCSNMKRKDAHRFYLTNGFGLTSYKFKRIK